MVNADYEAAVAAGNVETSSRVAISSSPPSAVPRPGREQPDAGNSRFPCYETFEGSQGACPDADGPNGVHRDEQHLICPPRMEAVGRGFPCASSNTPCP